MQKFVTMLLILNHNNFVEQKKHFNNIDKTLGII